MYILECTNLNTTQALHHHRQIVIVAHLLHPNHYIYTVWKVDWQRDREMEVKDELVKLDRNRFRKIECITNPYFNDSHNITYGWLALVFLKKMQNR